MSAFVLGEQAVLDYVDAHPNQVIYGPNGTFYIPQGDDVWRRVEGTDGDIDVILSHELLSGTSRRLPPDEVSRLFPAGSQSSSMVRTTAMADDIASLHVLTDECWQARDFLLEDRVEVVDDLDAVEALLPDGEFEAALERGLARCRVDHDTGTLTMGFCSYDDLRSLFTYSDIQDWLDRKPLSDFVRSEDVTHDRDGFVSYMTEKVCESSWWADAAYDEEMGVVDAILAEVEGAVHGGQLLPPYLEIDSEPMRAQLLERVVWDRVSVVPDIERAVTSWGDVCVDLFLTHGEEWNSDYSNIGLLYEAQQGRDLSQGALEDALCNNGMSWFAGQLGHPRDVMLKASEDGMAGHEFYEELLNVSSSTAVMTVFCRLPLGDWITCVEAKEKGEPIVLSGNTFYAGLVDPWGGGGSTLDMSLEGVLVVPSENVLDAAVDPSGRDVPRGPFGEPGLVSSRVYGVSVKSVYGTDESLYRPGFVNSPVAMERVGLTPRGGVAR